MNKTLMSFLSGVLAGGVFSLLFAPMKGSDLRTILMKQHGNDDGELHNFNISELTSENSVSFEEIKKHLQD